jgi:hypothetical protein
VGCVRGYGIVCDHHCLASPHPPPPPPVNHASHGVTRVTGGDNSGARLRRARKPPDAMCQGATASESTAACSHTPQWPSAMPVILRSPHVNDVSCAHRCAGMLTAPRHTTAHHVPVTVTQAQNSLKRHLPLPCTAASLTLVGCTKHMAGRRGRAVPAGHQRRIQAGHQHMEFQRSLSDSRGWGCSLATKSQMAANGGPVAHRI